MKKKIILILAVSVCFFTGCKNYIKDATESMRDGDYQAAVKLFEEAIEKDKSVAEAYQGIGMARYSQQDYAGAAEALNTALASGCKKTPVIYNMLGICAMQQQNYDEALVQFDTGISVSADMDDKEAADYLEVIQEMKYNQVVCYEKKLDWAAAKVRMEEYIKAYPDDSAAKKEYEFLQTR